MGNLPATRLPYTYHVKSNPGVMGAGAAWFVDVPGGRRVRIIATDFNSIYGPQLEQ